MSTIHYNLNQQAINQTQFGVVSLIVGNNYSISDFGGRIVFDNNSINANVGYIIPSAQATASAATQANLLQLKTIKQTEYNTAVAEADNRQQIANNSFQNFMTAKTAADSNATALATAQANKATYIQAIQNDPFNTSGLHNYYYSLISYENANIAAYESQVTQLENNVVNAELAYTADNALAMAAVAVRETAKNEFFQIDRAYGNSLGVTLGLSYFQDKRAYW